MAKSDPRIFLAALDHLHLAPQEVWMIGDDLAYDIAPAQQLGMIALWYDPSQQGLPEKSLIHPDKTIHILLELVDLLNEATISV